MQNAQVDLVYFDAGGGHRAAAQAVQAVAQQQQRDWNLRLVDLFEVLDPNAWIKRHLGFAPQDAYNWRLARGWTWGMRWELRALQSVIGLLQHAMARRLRAHWQHTRPDLVVSLVPNFNRPMRLGLQQACPGVPYVTVLTDLADNPPHFWMERGDQQHVVVGSALAQAQAQALGIPQQCITRTSGMVLRPQFHQPEPLPEGREAGLRALGLNPWQPVALMLFGGHGADTMLNLASALPDLQVIALCGHNQRLVDAFGALRRDAPHVAVGFTREVPRWMQLADLFIGKPGPGSLSEAVQMGLPVVTFVNGASIPQEVYNGEWVRENRLGLVVPTVREVPAAVQQILAALPAWRARVARMHNAAVYEVVDCLAALLARGNQATTAAAGSGKGSGNTARAAETALAAGPGLASRRISS